MNDYIKVDVKLTQSSSHFWGSKYCVVHYGYDPYNPQSLNRMIVIDEIPGSFFKFFGAKTIRRTFVGRASWFEILKDKKVRCPLTTEQELSKISFQIEKSRKKIIKAKRIKEVKR